MRCTMKIGSVLCDNLAVSLMIKDLIRLVSGDSSESLEKLHAGFGGWILTKEFMAQIVQWTNDAMLVEYRDELITMLEQRDIIDTNSIWHLADDMDYITLNYYVVCAFIEAFIGKAKTIKIAWIEEEQDELLDVHHRYD